MAIILKLLLLAVVFVLGLILHGRNSQPVTLDYYIGTWQPPLSLLLALALLCGAILGILAGVWPMLSLKRDNLRLKRRLKTAEAAPAARADVKTADVP